MCHGTLQAFLNLPPLHVTGAQSHEAGSKGEARASFDQRIYNFGAVANSIGPISRGLVAIVHTNGHENWVQHGLEYKAQHSLLESERRPLHAHV